MYGYEPPKSAAQPGGCRDTFVLVRVAFEVLAPIVLAGFAGIGFLALSFWLLATNLWLGLIPLAIVAGGVTWLVRRDHRLQREREREVRDVD